MPRRRERPARAGEGELLRRWNGRPGSRRRAGRRRRLGTGAQLVRAQPRDTQKAAFVKLVKYAHSPELLPTARKAFVSGSAESGAYLVRMLVLARQPAEAASFIATPRDDGVRNAWTDAQAEALAKTGNPAPALPLANTIADPVLRARALAAVADALKS
jgi:hypothetical protein